MVIRANGRRDVFPAHFEPDKELPYNTQLVMAIALMLDNEKQVAKLMRWYNLVLGP